MQFIIAVCFHEVWVQIESADCTLYKTSNQYVK